MGVYWGIPVRVETVYVVPVALCVLLQLLINAIVELVSVDLIMLVELKVQLLATDVSEGRANVVVKQALAPEFKRARLLVVVLLLSGLVKHRFSNIRVVTIIIISFFYIYKNYGESKSLNFVK